MESASGTARRIGLTGGIASGKSTVAKLLAARGAVVVDADAIVRELQRPGGAALEGIVDEFGARMLIEGGELDRAALGSLVFGDKDALSRLNAVVHPLVREEAARRIAEAPAGAVIVEDIPLLVETGQAGRFDRVVVVQAPRGERLRRMIEDRGMSEADAAARIDAQASDAERAAVATDLLMNDAGLAELETAVDALWRRITV